MRNHFLIILAAGLIAAAGVSAGVSAGENLALGKKYTLTPKPAYSHCTDDGDLTDLTDGKTTDQYFWTQKGTVGWGGAVWAEVTIDLQQEEPIDSVAFNSAAGVAGVQWPAMALLLVSPDGQAWYQVDDLMTLDVEQNGPRDASKYNLRKISGAGLGVKGRFVKIFFCPTSTFIFLDEVEILRGDDALLAQPYRGEPIASIQKLTEKIQFTNRLRQRYSQDTGLLAKLVSTAAESAADDTFKEKLADLAARVSAIKPDTAFCDCVDPAVFRTIFPYDSVHASIFSLQAELWRLLDPDAAPLIVRRTNPYDFIAPVGLIPTGDGETGPLVMAKNEIREAVWTLYNTTDQPMDVTVSLDGDFASAAEGAVVCFEVPWTDTASQIPVAAALIEVPKEENRWKITLSPGLPQQVWFDVHSALIPAGTYTGSVRFDAEPSVLAASDSSDTANSTPVSGGEQQTERKKSKSGSITLRVANVTLPTEQTLILGGWDYADGGGAYNVNATNIDSFLATMKAYGVNGPWGRGPLVFSGLQCKKKENGTFDVSFDTKPMTDWLALWPDAKEYYIFLSVPNSFAGIPFESGDFSAAVATWSKKWGEFFVSRGIDPSRVAFLVRDEPGMESERDHRSLIAWSNAINAGESRFNIWEDPVYTPPTKLPSELFDVCETLCPNRPQWLNDRDGFEAVYRKVHERGKRLDFYSCSGPVRLLDPYSYFRLQAWHLYAEGGKASFFWALGDGAQVSCWNEYLLPRNGFCPMFIDPNDPATVPAKQLAAMRESVFDFELLTAFGRFLDQEKAAGRDAASLEQLLVDGLESVLWSDNASQIGWLTEKDRSKADQLRVQLLDLLEKP